MSNPIHKIQNHLDSNKLHYIDVLDEKLGDIIYNKLFINDIVNKHGSLDGFFKKILSDGINRLQIIKKKKLGTSNRLVGAVIPLQLGTKPEESAQVHGLNNPAYQQPKSPEVIQSQMQTSQLNQELLYKSRILDLEERISAYKSDLLEEKEDHRSTRRKLEQCYDDIRELTVEKQTNDKNLELALKEERLNNKSWYDAENLPQITESLTGLASPFMGVKTEAATSLNGVANANYGPRKNAILQALEYPQVDESICKIIGEAINGLLIHRGTFGKELEKLIKKHKINLEENDK
jgi:hypothetical protein